MSSYFLLHAQTGKRSEFRTYAALQSAASQINVQLHFDAIELSMVATDLRGSIGAAAFAMFGIPALYALLLSQRTMRLRRRRVVICGIPQNLDALVF